MERRQLNVPLIIGGATTSKLHTAVKIAPERIKAPTIYVPDASKSVSVVSHLLNQDARDSFISNEYETYEKLRNAHKHKQKKIFSLNEARNRKYFKKHQPVKPLCFKPLIVESVSVNDLIPFIDWTPFFKVWEIKGTYPEILKNPKKKKEANKIFNDAGEMLKEIGRNKLLEPKGVCGFFKAATVDDDDIIIFPHDNNGKSFIYNSMREQSPLKPDAPCGALADFIAPANSGITDYIGAFAVTAGHELPVLIKKYKKQFDDYSIIMLKAIADRLAEAFAEYLHLKVRTQYWAYAENEKFSPNELIQETYQGIRPAPGYPACPDHYGKNIIFELLDVPKHTGITLTENTAMTPAASVCGLYFASPQSHYFYINRIADDQLKSLAKRSSRDINKLKQNLAYLL
jgi:5-methyltetrahydrofolate--homocysteine methyltransferase